MQYNLNKDHKDQRNGIKSKWLLPTKESYDISSNITNSHIIKVVPFSWAVSASL